MKPRILPDQPAEFIALPLRRDPPAGMRVDWFLVVVAVLVTLGCLWLVAIEESPRIGGCGV